MKAFKTHPSQKVVLLIQSWGSMLGADFTRKYPNEINGLVLAEPDGLKWNDVLECVGNSWSFKLWGESLNDVNYLDQFITGSENQHEVLDVK